MAPDVVLMEKSSVKEIHNGTLYFHLETQKVLEIVTSTAKMVSFTN
jgi:hypothetical protein